jgi:hypothetical protein
MLQLFKLGGRSFGGRARVACAIAVAVVSFSSPVGASPLSDAAAALQPGQWTTLSTTGFNDSLLNIGGTILAYSEEMKWDSQKNEMHFVGAYHYQPVAHIVYNESTNTWAKRTLDASVFGQPFHSYDHMAIDPATRKMWVRPFGAGGALLKRYDLDAKTWTNTAAFTGGLQDAVGIEYFPDLKKVVYIDEGAVRLYDPANNSWGVSMTSPAGLGPYHNIAEYSPVHKVMIMGGGNDSRALYRMNSSGQITRLKDAPVVLGIGNSIVTVDPISGDFLVLTKSKQFYQFNPMTDVWTALGSSGVSLFSLSTEFPDIQGAAASPIPQYGVVMVAKYNGSNSKVYLYRHKPGSGAVVTQPTVTLNASPTSVSSGATTSLSWSSTNADSCTASGAWSGTKSTSGSQQSTALSTNSTFSLTCTNSSGGAQTAAVTVSVTTTSTPPPSTPSAGGDFSTRCSAPGVVRCYGFENPSELEARSLPRRDGVRMMQITGDQKASGNYSLKFTIPPLTGPDTSGSFFLNFADDLSQRFGEGQDLYVQWRQRFSPDMLRAFKGGNGWKQVIVGAGDYPGKTNYTCTEQETVVQQDKRIGVGFPAMYHSCGTWEVLEFWDGTQVRMQHQGPPYCYYPTDPQGGCMQYKPDQWMTFQMHIKVSKWNEPKTSTFEMWVNYENGPSVKIFDSALAGGFTYFRTEDPNAFFGKIWLLPYNTNKDPTENHPTAYTWYDDVIISRSRIPDPGTTAKTPNPPTNVTVR